MPSFTDVGKQYIKTESRELVIQFIIGAPKALILLFGGSGQLYQF